MSMFGFYFVSNLLNQAGWPRKKWFFGGSYCDTLIVDTSIDQMLGWSASLAAGLPESSLRIIAEMHRDKDWEGTNPPDITIFIEGAQREWDKHLDGSPTEVIQPKRLSNMYGKSIPAKLLADRKIIAGLEELCHDTIMWGLGNPARVKKWYERHRQAMNAKLTNMKRAGLQVDTPPGWDDWIEECASILSDYEREIQPLPQIPRKLRQDAKKVGVVLN